MPIYEFYSPDTHKIYSFFARRLYDPVPVPKCPDGENCRMQREVSRFAFIGRAKEPSADGTGAGDDLDPRQEAAMMEIAREMENMGDGDPDPKMLGRMMRKMLDITGQNAPREMEEMLRRLESGEDPEKLEEEYGDVMDSFDPEGDPQSVGETFKKHRALLRRAPTRDPQLYEFADFL